MRILIIAAVAALGAFGVSHSHASEIKVISANGMREVLYETKAKFEADTGHQLTITVVESGEIRRRVLAGEKFDVIMVPKDLADELEKAGKTIPGTAVQLIRVDFGLAVPNDGLRPDVSTPEALKNAFLHARTVLITDPKTGGVSGVHLMEVLEKLGITEEMKSRLVPQPGIGLHAARVARGEADMAVQSEHEIRCVRGVMFLPYPAVFQNTTRFMGGVASTSGDVTAAKAYLHYVTSSETDNAYSAHCLRRG
jgi:molybdate transport system substrate-binding protein